MVIRRAFLKQFLHKKQPNPQYLARPALLKTDTRMDSGETTGSAKEPAASGRGGTWWQWAAWI
jgi:hypothetical protein